jgi:hypothetical protein
LKRFTRFMALAWALAVSPFVESATTNLQLPDYIGVLEFMGARTPRGAHVASSYSYRAAGLSLDIDVFDYSVSQLQAGIDDPLLKDQYEKAKAAARSSAPRRAKLLGEDVVQFGTRQRFAAREAVYRLTHSEFEQTSYLWLAEVQGRLLEMRFTVQQGFEEDGHVSRSEILAALGEEVVRPLESIAVPRVNVAIVWDPQTPAAEKQLWMTYLLTRASQAAQESSDRELPLGERQASFEEETRARTMAVNTFRDLQARGLKVESTYFSDLERVDAAGFLREYVWRYLRRDSWITAPPGLKLTAFDEWRASYLEHHVAVTHGAIALRLATAQGSAAQ